MFFELRQYDKTLLTFDFIEKHLEGQECHIVSVNEECKNLLPIGMELTSDGLYSWLKTRVVPKNREFVEQILSRHGLSQKDTLGIIKLCKGLSLNDSYWIVEEGFSGKFANYNLYQNSFARTLALIAYTGYGSSSAKGFASSPEFTTNGMLRKCWRRINKKIYLYKGGTFGAANTGKEPYSEYYASQIAEKMGINHVEYGLSKWKDTLCSTCELFTNINVSYVPIYKFVNKVSLPEIAKYLKDLGESYYDGFVDMLIFDAVIFNTDRHGGNFGLMVDNITNRPISFAPIFDNGLSLFNFAMQDEMENLEKYSKTRLSAFNVSFDDIAKEYMTLRQKKELRKLINFKFKKHPKYNLPKDRLNKIEDFIQARIRYLLEI